MDANGLEILTDELIQDSKYSAMEDVELVLRFFAHRQRPDLQSYSLSNYLDFYLKHGNSFTSNVLNELQVKFENSIRIAYSLFGGKAFHLYRLRAGNWKWFSRPTTSVYDPMMFAISQNLHNEKQILSRKDVYVKKIGDFYKQNYESFEGRNTNKSILAERNQLFLDFIKNNLGK